MAEDTPLSLTREGLYEVLGDALDGAISHLAGVSFGGRRDYYTALGYKRNITFNDYLDRYRRDPIAHQLCEIYPDYAWRPNPVVFEDPDPKTQTELEAFVAAFAARLDLWEQLRLADIYCNIGKFSALLIGAPGDLNTPLILGTLPEDISFVRPFHQGQISISKWFDREEDENTPLFGMPAEYKVKVSTRNRRVDVHWSRIVHIADGVIYGYNYLERGWNDLEDILKVTGGGAEAAWKRSDPGYVIKRTHEEKSKPQQVPGGTRKVILSDKKRDEMKAEVEDFIHNRTRTLFMEDAEVQELFGQVFSYQTNAETSISKLCAGYGVPRGLLLGQQIGELFTGQDRFNFSRRVKNYRETRGTKITKSFFQRLIDFKVKKICEPRTGSYGVFWPEIDEMTIKEQSDVVLNLARANQIERVITADEMREKVLNFGPLEEDQK